MSNHRAELPLGCHIPGLKLIYMQRRRKEVKEELKGKM